MRGDFASPGPSRRAGWLAAGSTVHTQLFDAPAGASHRRQGSLTDRVLAMPQDHALWMLSKYAEEAKEIERLTLDWVQKARAAEASWEQIGTALGVSRQAAQQRFGRNVP